MGESLEFECKCGFSCQKDPLMQLKDCNVDGYIEVINSTVFCDRIVYFGNKRLTSCPVLLRMFEEQNVKDKKSARQTSEIKRDPHQQSDSSS
jgi:hypothetical protein